MRCTETPTESQDARLVRAATLVNRELPSDRLLVYVSGSTTFHSSYTKPICEMLGSKLADIQEVCLVTGGFAGVGKVMAEHFAARCEELKSPNRLWHLIPYKDDKDFSKVSTQGPDKRFGKAPSGKSVFCGESVRERESIAAHVAHLCILLEGGPGASHEAEQFAWLDKVVLPVPCTGGAAAGGVPGKFKVADRVFHAPPGVPIDLWKVLMASTDVGSGLSQREAARSDTPASAANTVADIVSTVAASDYALSVRRKPVSPGRTQSAYVTSNATSSVMKKLIRKKSH